VDSDSLTTTYDWEKNERQESSPGELEECLPGEVEERFTVNTHGVHVRKSIYTVPDFLKDPGNKEFQQTSSKHSSTSPGELSCRSFFSSSTFAVDSFVVLSNVF
jgi:hypothetical protein